MVEPIPLHSPSLHDNVAARLRQRIFDRHLAPGALVDELALAQQWGISRTPLREALKVLAAEGLVKHVPRRGCHVATIQDAEAERLFPVMAMLEGRCALEAVQRATPDDVARLKIMHAALERHAARGDLDGYYTANHVFHSAVQALAQNPWLDRVTNDLRQFMRLWRGRQLALPGRIKTSIQEHRALMAAIEAGKATRAEQLMHDHLMAQLDALKALQRVELGATRQAPRRRSTPKPAAKPATQPKAGKRLKAA